jgi:hypothetical protein
VKERTHGSIHFDMATLNQLTRTKGIPFLLPAMVALSCSGRVELAQDADHGGGGNTASATGGSGAGGNTAGGRSTANDGGIAGSIAATFATASSSGSGGVPGLAGAGTNSGAHNTSTTLPNNAGSSSIATNGGTSGTLVNGSTAATSGGTGTTGVATGASGGTDPHYSAASASGGSSVISTLTTVYASGGTNGMTTMTISIGGNTTTVITLPARGGDSAIAAAGSYAAAGSAGASSCAGVSCPILSEWCSSIVQRPGACCPVCLATTCPTCPDITSCPSEQHIETPEGACCPQCVADACPLGQKTYAELLSEVSKKYSIGCATSPDCTIAPEKNACAESCGIPVPNNMLTYLEQTLESTAKGCVTCAPPTPTSCPAVVPACVNGRCVAASPSD